MSDKNGVVWNDKLDFNVSGPMFKIFAGEWEMRCHSARCDIQERLKLLKSSRKDQNFQKNEKIQGRNEIRTASHAQR